MKWPWSRDRRRLERARRELEEVRRRTPKIEESAQRAEHRLEENQFGARFRMALGGDR